MASKESYTVKKELKPLDRKKYSSGLIKRAYSSYLKDFRRHGFEGNSFTLFGFERHAYNRDLFLEQTRLEERSKKINKINEILK